MATEDATTNPPEVWKPVVGYEGLYEVSDKGRVRSLTRRMVDSKGREQMVIGRIMRPGGSRYFGVCLSGKGKVRRRLVHALVLEAFVGPRPVSQEGRHLNGNSFDCRVENLLWGTTKENGLDRCRHGTQVSGEKSHLSKLTEAEVRAIRRLYQSGEHTRPELALMFDVTLTNICDICAGKSWRRIL